MPKPRRAGTGAAQPCSTPGGAGAPFFGFLATAKESEGWATDGALVRESLLAPAIAMTELLAPHTKHLIGKEPAFPSRPRYTAPGSRVVEHARTP